jgi:hypothetical protein
MAKQILPRASGMTPKSVKRFLEKIMPKQEKERGI